MRKLYYLPVIFLMLAFSAQAQQDSIRQEIDTLQLLTSRIDPITGTLKHETDSVNSKSQKGSGSRFQVSGLKAPGGEALTSSLNKAQDSAKNAEKKIEHKLDSLNPQHQVEQYNRKVQVLQKHLSNHIDSLSNLKIKTPQLTQSMDSLRGKLDSLKNAGPVKDLKKAEQQLAQLQTKLNSKVKGLQSKMSKDLGDIGNLGGNIPKVNLPNVKLPTVNLPNTNLPNVNLPNLNTKLPGVSTNLNLNTNLPGTNLPSVGSTSIPGVSTNTSVPSLSTNGTLPTNELNGISKEVTQTTGQLGQVQKEVQNMSTGNLEGASKDLEKTALKNSELKSVSGDVMKADEYKKMVEKWQSDPEYRKEMAVTKAKEQAINHFAGQEQALMAAMQKLSDVKKKYKDYEGVLDMFKKPGNPMKGKPFIERLRPGYNFQIQAGKDVWLDINPQVGYRISGRLTAGIGWNERWGVDVNKWNYMSNDHAYGPRAYAQVKIKSGVFALLAPEVMSAFVHSYNSPDPPVRKWVWSWMAGIKKEFQVSKRTLGNIQLLYNFYNPGKLSPYVSEFNVRMGFEFPLKKKK